MTAVIDRASGGAIFANLVIVLLLAVAVGLYLQLVMVQPGATDTTPVAAASVRVVEQAIDSGGQGLVPLPEDQVRLIKQVFAPELL
ncbi:MAG: hypothetical protein KDI88_19005 [Gammaproteobacteria bacterium]|nr:hypothetical protein [Gammaproteobacteria bacterium]